MIRKATVDDVGKFIHLVEEHIKFHEKQPPERSKLITHLQFICAHEEVGCLFIAEKNNQIAGFATLYKTYSTFQAKKALKMNDFYIAPAWRKQGVGKLLLQTCKQYFEEGDYAYMEWLVSPTEQETIDFYLKNKAMKTDWILFGYSNEK